MVELRAQGTEWNADITRLRQGVHIHVPAGATPKDGPSAGVTMAVALASLYADKPARSDTTMTGEITLTGLVLPVGGIKEKILAAKRAGIKEIILCKQNERDIEEINKEFIKEMKFHYVTEMKEVLGLALEQNVARNSVDLSIGA